MKKISLSCLLVVLLQSMSFTQWISLDKFSIPNSQPAIQLVSDDNFSTVIKVEISGFQINEFVFQGKTYQSINLTSNGITTEAGYPEIPHIAKILAIPDQGTVSVEILETSPVQIIKGINVPPARESWIEGQPETPYVENLLAYSSEDVFPGSYAKVEDPVIFRDFRIARVSIFPIRYSPSRQEIQAVSSITIKVSYTNGFGINPKTTLQKPIAPSFAKLYKNFLFNYDEVLKRRYDGMETGHDIMMCIMPDLYIEEFQPYADWKHKSGTEIIITKFSDIGANQSNPDIIKNYILSVYNSWDNVPTHILIVGDYGSPVGNAPVKYWTGSGWTFVNEDYFVELEGNDYFPEMMIGRFTNYNGVNGGGEQILEVMVNKFLKYERYPYTAETAWYKKGIVCSNDYYQSQVDTKRFAAQLMREGGGFTLVDTMMSNPQCTYDEGDIITALNEGRSFLNYRGEGWDDGWHASCYYFNSSHVNSLNNANKLTFVTSIGCGVAMFDAGNCFGETWIEMGSLTVPRGGCAFIGPTSNTHTTYNNWIDRGIYTGMFPQITQPGLSYESPGEALVGGKLFMYEHFGGSDPYVQYHFKIYCVLGDPSIHIWKNIPEAVTITHPNEIYVGYDQVQITVNNTSTGLPVSTARICISGNGVYETGITDAYGMATLDITPVSVGSLSVTVTGGNVIPNEDSIVVLLGTENITPHGNPFVTDLDGNNDGLINPNENGSITFTLKNWGTISSNDVYAILSVPDSASTYVEMTTDSVVFGNIAPEDSITGSPFLFFVKPECPVGYEILFRLHVSSTTSSWDYNNMETVHGCMLNFSEFYIDDEGSVLQNYRMDPGETVKVKFNILNLGDDDAPNVTGIISTDDPFMTIVDSIAVFGTILPDSNSINEADTYTITVSESCPVQYYANFTLKLSTENGLYPYSSEESVILPVAIPSASDPTGPDLYGYYAFSSYDFLWDQRPEYEWVDIAASGIEIPKPGGVSDFTQTVNLPFNFKYYGNNFTQVRISGDGWIAFGSGSQTKSGNQSIPCLDSLNNMTAVFWDDFFSNGPQGGGKLCYYSDESNHRFIIEWDTVPHRSDITDKETFEIILLDPAYYPTPTGDGEIIFQYKEVEEAGSCTVGIENSTEDVGLQYLFNEIYDATADELVNGLAIKFTTKAPTVVSVDDDGGIKELVPTAYKLEQNYPNPFNPQTIISYSIPEQAFVKLCIYDINGTLVKSLLEGNQSAGSYQMIWNGENSTGIKVGSGVYFYRIQANSFVQTRKMILLK